MTVMATSISCTIWIHSGAFETVFQLRSVLQSGIAAHPRCAAHLGVVAEHHRRKPCSVRRWGWMHYVRSPSVDYGAVRNTTPSNRLSQRGARRRPQCRWHAESRKQQVICTGCHHAADCQRWRFRRRVSCRRQLHDIGRCLTRRRRRCRQSEITHTAARVRGTTHCTLCAEQLVLTTRTHMNS
jgi:hypothetical protein